MSEHIPFPWRDPERWAQPATRWRVGRRLAQDLNYRQLWRECHDIDRMERAGFFDDGLTRKEQRALGLGNPSSPAHGIWNTPFPTHLSQTDKKKVALLSTGAFAPFHAGHASMMDMAVEACVAQGWEVIACYFSPSHDLYVKSKDEGRAACLTAPIRIHEARSAVEGVRGELGGLPLWVDPWESQVATRPLNFTDVIRRLEHYLHRQLGESITVGFVFGADNAGFAQAFSHAGLGICVGRPGYDAKDTSHGIAQAGGICLYVDGQSDLSSTKLRLDRNRNASPTTHLPAKGSYTLRDEGAWATQHWEHRIDPRILQLAWGEFVGGVKKQLQKAFLDDAISLKPALLPAPLRHWPQPTRWDSLPLEGQLEWVRKWAQEGTLLSLDPCLSQEDNVVAWPWSRRFVVSSHQPHPIGFGARPTHELPNRLPERVILVDDDQATGATLASALAVLSDRTDITDMRFLAEASLAGRDIFDVVDCRDFLPGAKEAGLVVETPKGTFRVPYMGPFVDLTTRARIPPTQSHALGKRLWAVAEQFFANMPYALRVEDMDRASRLAFLGMGFADNTRLDALCQKFQS